ncbi:hypothetical protein CKO40_04710 [Halochromatium glycolicum]|uniref:Uncharacterized protein n=2 Tax=Halochromatium glycolicum TaxID=85075 RepID=A0AAJ0U291_9GAMM|nr:hypothetical protein [Halochromatium glycolicum]
MSIKPTPPPILFLLPLLIGMATADAAETRVSMPGAEAHPQRTGDHPVPAERVLAGRESPPPNLGAGSSHQVPRWLKEVRAQRRALQQQRRAAHQARHEALDPIGAAKREERQERRLRRRQEVREFIEHERRLYLNWGPWITPLVPRPPPTPGVDPLTQGSIGSSTDAADGPPAAAPNADGAAIPTPSDWDNRWYYNGW